MQQSTNTNCNHAAHGPGGPHGRQRQTDPQHYLPRQHKRHCQHEEDYERHQGAYGFKKHPELIRHARGALSPSPAKMRQSRSEKRESHIDLGQPMNAMWCRPRTMVLCSKE